MKRRNKWIAMFTAGAVFVSGCHITNSNVLAASTAINTSKVSIALNNSYKLKITNNKKKVKWSSKNKNIATVNSSGKVVAKKSGSTTITATVGTKKFTCKVTVPEQYITHDDIFVYVDTEKKVAMHGISDSDQVVWSCDDPDVAAISEDGVITGKRSARTFIRASVNPGIGKSYVCRLFVLNMDSNYKPPIEIEEDNPNAPEIIPTPTPVVTPEPSNVPVVSNSLKVKNEFPETYSYMSANKEVYSKVKISSIEHTFKRNAEDPTLYDLKLLALSQKLYDMNGWKIQPCEVRYRLYDETATLVATGFLSAREVGVGDRFYMAKVIRGLPLGHYTLVLEDEIDS